MANTLINSEIIRGALDGLKSHKLRSGLTALGVIFGVAAVISMASIGEGARREALRQIELLGASNIIINEARPEEGEERKIAIKKNPLGLNQSDVEALESTIEGIKLIVPERNIPVQVSSGIESGKFEAVASTPEIFELQENQLISGRLFTWLDLIDNRRVCVLGFGAKRKLFPLEKAVGEEIHGSGAVFTVIGVVDRQLVGDEIEGIEMRDRNQDIYLPLSTSMNRYPPKKGDSELDKITVQLNEMTSLKKYSSTIQRMLHRRHHEVNDFAIVVPEELLRQHQETQRIFNIVMGTIASISLLVGGIGIMNIMLASVLERTREIGIRRALGARRSDIAKQFLTEATMLSIFGGAIGVIIGILLAKAISVYAGWETAVSVWSILIAVGVSVGVGIIFGFLPARNAAKLDPITALRFE